MPAPTAGNAGLPSAMLDPKAAVVNAAKKKLLGTAPKDSAATVPAAPQCLTPDAYAAAMKAQQTAALKGAATAMLTATPVGMAVVGAKAAAPVAGKVAGALGGRFRRGPSKEDMLKELATGRLMVEGIRFDAGSESPNSGSAKVLGLLAEVMKASENRFTVRVTPESDGKAAADPKLAHKRARQIVTALVAAGIPATRLAEAPLTNVVSWEAGPPKKAEAKVEIVAIAAGSAR